MKFGTPFYKKGFCRCCDIYTRDTFFFQYAAIMGHYSMKRKFVGILGFEGFKCVGKMMLKRSHLKRFGQLLNELLGYSKRTICQQNNIIS